MRADLAALVNRLSSWHDLMKKLGSFLDLQIYGADLGVKEGWVLCENYTWRENGHICFQHAIAFQYTEMLVHCSKTSVVLEPTHA